MAESFFAKITPVRHSGGPTDPGYGVDEGVDPGYGIPGPPAGIALPPIALPPLPGVWPPAGRPSLPIHLPPAGVATPPIYIPEPPDKPITLPPGTIWPPLPPPEFPDKGKTAILIWVVGVGARWFIYDPAQKPPPSGPKQQ